MLDPRPLINCFLRSLFAAALVQILFLSGQTDGQTSIDESTSPWKPVSESAIANRGRRLLLPEKYVVAGLDRNALKKIFDAAPLEFSEQARSEQVIFWVPRPDGTFIRFRIEESPILSPEIAAKHPQWKTFQGYAVDLPGVTARFDWTADGFHGYVLAAEGTFSIDPYQTNDTENYIVFYKGRFGARQGVFHCKLDELLSEEREMFKARTPEQIDFSDFVHGSQIRTYRLAVATTVEYTNFFRQAGDNDEAAKTRALSRVVTSINRIDAVYRKELAVSFVLVSGTNLIYAVDPEIPANYNNNGSSSDLNANQINVDSVIGSANYDVAHLFETGDGGIASLASVCGSSKARGLSGLPEPLGDPFDVDYVAHELGHQFAANHTFNATSDCGSSPAAARKEPGSAVTIMGYAGICSSTANIQRNSIDTFHIHNLTESINFITTGNGSTCGTLNGTNAPPVIASLQNYTIPFNTPFALTASATDADGDPLTYSWEQNDAAASTSNYPSTTDDDDLSLVFRPGFRSYLPTTDGTRTFPSLTYVLNDSNEPPVTYSGLSATGSICETTCITGEDLPSAARTMNFRVSVRDGRGGISDAGTAVSVVNTTTPFRVTSQNTNPAVWAANSLQTVTWDVSGTTANGIDTANVKISFSVDGGQTFPFVAAASTPNDGSQSVVVPKVATDQARIKIEGVGNIFFDVNDVGFQIADSVGGRAPFDFDGDGKTDVSIFRPSVGEWWYRRSLDGQVPALQFGSGTDVVTAVDFTGDGKTDIAFFRPATGEWFVLRSEDGSFYSFPFGAAGDIPVPADYDADGEADPAVFRPSSNLWIILRSSDQGVTFTQFGITGDQPTAADYDGDGKADVGVFRPNGATGAEWWIARSTAGVVAFQFGQPTDRTVPADYTGDGKADVATWRQATGEWYILRSEDSSFFSFPFGTGTDVPSPGDYDGDGKNDAGVFRPSNSTWYLLGSTSGTQIIPFGTAGDIPLPSAFVR